MKLRRINSILGEATRSDWFSTPSEKGSTLKGKNATLGKKVFRFLIDLFFQNELDVQKCKQ